MEGGKGCHPKLWQYVMAIMVECRKTSVDTSQVGLENAPLIFISFMEEYSVVENFDEWV